MKLRTILSISALMFILVGCAGQQAQINPGAIGYLKKDYGVKIRGPVTFSTAGYGAQNFSGRPSGLNYAVYSVSVDLKSIQDASAKTVLGSIYEEVRDFGANSQIISYITDFNYHWPISLKTKASVNFNLHIKAIKNGKAVYEKTIPVNVEGEGDTDWSGAFGVLGEALSGSVDKRSQMVGDVTLKAVHSVYEKEMPGIAKLL